MGYLCGVVILGGLIGLIVGLYIGQGKNPSFIAFAVTLGILLSMDALFVRVVVPRLPARDPRRPATIYAGIMFALIVVPVLAVGYASSREFYLSSVLASPIGIDEKRTATQVKLDGTSTRVDATELKQSNRAVFFANSSRDGSLQPTRLFGVAQSKSGVSVDRSIAWGDPRASVLDGYCVAPITPFGAKLYHNGAKPYYNDKVLPLYWVWADNSCCDVRQIASDVAGGCSEWDIPWNFLIEDPSIAPATDDALRDAQLMSFDKMNLSLGARQTVAANTHWVRQLNADKEEEVAANRQQTGMFMVLIAIFAWPLLLLLFYPCAIRDPLIKRSLHRGSLIKREKAALAYNASFDKRQRATLKQHCPLPNVLQDVVLEYVKLSHDERTEMEMAFLI
jgi:hypothetical protein